MVWYRNILSWLRWRIEVKKEMDRKYWFWCFSEIVFLGGTILLHILMHSFSSSSADWRRCPYLRSYVILFFEKAEVLSAVLIKLYWWHEEGRFQGNANLLEGTDNTRLFDLPFPRNAFFEDLGILLECGRSASSKEHGGVFVTLILNC